MREIYFPSFEKAVKEAGAWSVMCSYNKVNGTYASENRRLLTEILKDEWDFRGTRHVGLVCYPQHRSRR